MKGGGYLIDMVEAVIKVEKEGCCCEGWGSDGGKRVISRDRRETDDEVERSN